MRKHRKSSALEEILDLLASLPWWVCIALAPLSYLFLHRWAVPIQSSDFQGQGGSMGSIAIQQGLIRGLALASQYIVPLLCVVAAVLSAWRRKQRKALVAHAAQATSVSVLNATGWREFELLVGEAYRLQGYRVAEHGGSAPDGGVDLVLTKGAERFFVQCKQWKALKVGVATVRELYGVMAAGGATGGFVVTSGRFTRDAEEFAEGRNIELVDGASLIAMVQQGRHQPASSSSVQRDAGTVTSMPALHAATPEGVMQGMPTATTPRECPRCGGAMKLRIARKGAHCGETFWGCCNYPNCHGTRPG